MMWMSTIITIAGAMSVSTATTLEQCEIVLIQQVDRMNAGSVRDAYCQSAISNDRVYVIKDGRTLP